MGLIKSANALITEMLSYVVQEATELDSAWVNSDDSEENEWKRKLQDFHIRSITTMKLERQRRIGLEREVLRVRHEQVQMKQMLQNVSNENAKLKVKYRK